MLFFFIFVFLFSVCLLWSITQSFCYHGSHKLLIFILNILNCNGSLRKDILSSSFTTSSSAPRLTLLPNSSLQGPPQLVTTLHKDLMTKNTMTFNSHLQSLSRQSTNITCKANLILRLARDLVNK